MNAPISITYQSEYNSETTKYTGPLAIVKYEGPKNAEGQMEGDGEVLFANGSVYKGSFMKDMLHGFGVLKEKNGTVYTGEFFEDKRQGKATFIYPGGRYEGNCYSSSIPIMLTSNSNLIGEYFDNKRHGKGKEIGDDGNIFEVEFENGDFVRGKVQYSNDDLYIGEYKNDCRHGQGKFIRFEDDAVFEGRWEDDQFMGK